MPSRTRLLTGAVTIRNSDESSEKRTGWEANAWRRSKVSSAMRTAWALSLPGPPQLAVVMGAGVQAASGSARLISRVVLANKLNGEPCRS